MGSGETNRQTIFVIFPGNTKGLSVQSNIESLESVINFIVAINYFVFLEGVCTAVSGLNYLPCDESHYYNNLIGHCGVFFGLKWRIQRAEIF